jgi:hypothetical protein
MIVYKLENYLKIEKVTHKYHLVCAKRRSTAQYGGEVVTLG